MKVVINKCYGGFGLSPVALVALYQEGMTDLAHPVQEYFGKDYLKDSTIIGYRAALDRWNEYLRTGKEGTFLTVFTEDGEFVIEQGREIDRNDPRLVEIVERLGINASGRHAKLVVIDIPEGTDWEVSEYDGYEKVVEKHRSWE